MDRDEWNERYAGHDLLWHSEPNQFLVEEVGDLAPGVGDLAPGVGDLAPGKVLDIACGEGRNAIWLAERGWRATGVDFSSVALAKARNLARTRRVDVQWIEADLREWRPAELFGLVIAMYLHLPEEPRTQTFEAAARAIAPGGTILIVGHDRENVTAGTGGPQDESVLFTAEEVAKILEGVGGFTIERAAQVHRPVATDHGTVDALDALVRAVRNA